MGIGAIILESNLLSHTMVPAGSLTQSHDQSNDFRLTKPEEQQFQRDVLATNRLLREGYWNLFKEEEGREG